MKLRTGSIVLAAVALSACGTSKLLVEQPAQAGLRVHSVALQHQNKVNGVPAAANSYLQARMDESFFSRDPAFGRGSDITVRYGFASSRRGLVLTRLVLGSKTVVEAEILDQQGNVLSRMQSRHNIKLLGGVSYLAIDRAVAEIRDYAVAHFQQRTSATRPNSNAIPAKV